jgi:hypothetical protein
MSDPRIRFKTLDGIATPDLWADILRRAEASAPESLDHVVRLRATVSGGTQARSRRRLGTLALAVLLGALLVLGLAVGGLIAGAWRLGPAPTPTATFARTAHECAIPSQIGSAPVVVYDTTGTVIDCAVTGEHVLPVGSGIGLAVLSSPNRLRASWSNHECHGGADVQFDRLADGYSITVERDAGESCGSGPRSIELRLTVPLRLDDLSATLRDKPTP